MKPKREIISIAALVLLVGGILAGCSAWRGEGPSELSYDEPNLPPLARPKTVEASRFLGTSPSGHLHDLLANKIAIAALPDFPTTSDPITYLQNVVRREKSRGTSYLPYHFYIAPSGDVFQGQSERRCGYLEGKLVRDSFLIGVMGDYSNPVQFIPEAQQMALIQTCAWLCYEYAIQAQNIVPAPQLNPESPPLGENLAIWFGPTQTLQSRVNSTLTQEFMEADEGPRHPFYKGINRQDEISSRF